MGCASTVHFVRLGARHLRGKQEKVEHRMEDNHRVDVGWIVKQIQFRYSISYACLFRVTRFGKLYRCPFDPSTPDVLDVGTLPLHLTENVDFVAIADGRIDQRLPRIQALPAGLLYCLNQTDNYFIELQGSFENYLQLLSSKTRSTLRRKLRKFTELSCGRIDFRVYRSPAEMREYHKLARTVAQKTYQEKLFQGGLPGTQEFCSEVQRLASDGRVRGFLLFLDERPVAYLYVPILEGVAEYAFLGYDPDVAEHSPGSVLLYLAIQHLFAEQSFKYFNFGYGVSQTKSVFSTGTFLRADVYLFHNSFRNRAVLYSHTWMNDFAEFGGRILDRFGLRRAIKRWLRFR
jgi:CelD/BcsL family acetyltransferase involved in cellulose biosynthesis